MSDNALDLGRPLSGDVVELSILNPAGEEVGERFAARRNELIESGCGSLDQVRAIVAAAERDGLLES